MSTSEPDTSQGSESPPLGESPYRAKDSERRERWWYADALWLNQGTEITGVSITWAHWLADRGVQVDGQIDEDFARRMDREMLGEEATPDRGVLLSESVRVLQSFGLLEGSRRCPDSKSVIDTLLEQGPVIAGFMWRQSMFAPVDVEGWAVCRPDENDTVLGSHCVLLNGIALDLTIDGVTGFVRLKNSWGTDWGDGGHALISLADMETALQREDSLLPIPASDVLPAGLRQDIATDGVPYGPKEELYERSAIDGDRWTKRDTLGAGAYADAIARGIQHAETQPPLTIGIKGAWGAGKTSLMRMIQDRLEWPGENRSSEKPRPIHLTTKARERLAVPKSSGRRSTAEPEVTNRAALRQVKNAGSVEATPQHSPAKRPLGKRQESLASPQNAAASNDDRWRPTVWFNPWMYQTGEQIWAGLANEIIEQITNRLESRWEKEHFWLHLNRKRVDEQAVRRQIYGLVLGRAVPFLITGLFLLLIGLIVLASNGAAAIGRALAIGGPGVAAIGTAVTAWGALNSKVSGGLAGLVEPVSAAGSFAGEQLATLHGSAIENPDYRNRSGALYLVQADVQRVLDLVVTPDRPLVIFIDDLDRCAPGSVVQVIEAVNLFVAGNYPNTIFVIAMEPEMVAAHIEAVYGDLVNKLAQTSGGNGQAFDLGWRFLEKIVQLPLAVPAMEHGRTEALFESLFPGEIVPSQSQDAGAAATGEDPPGAEEISQASLSQALEIAANVQPDAAAKEAVRRVVERRLSVDDPEVKAVMAYAIDYLHHNPREIKRFVNLFRFFTMIYTERRLQKLPSPSSLREVAKLAVLGIRWPGLLSVLAQPAAGEPTRTIFELLEDPPPGTHTVDSHAALKNALEDARLSDDTIERLLTPDLRAFLTAEPVVGDGVRGYL